MITALQVTCGSLGLSTATVRLIAADGVEHTACSVGTGPVDAAYKAVDLIVKVWKCSRTKLKNAHIFSKTENKVEAYKLK